MSQGPLCPNLSQKVQKEVSQMANRNLSPVILLGGLSVNLNHLKISSWFEMNGFNQLIDQQTTDQGSLLDHVYFNGVSLIQTEVCDTYYSDHDCTIIAIANTRSQ